MNWHWSNWQDKMDWAIGVLSFVGLLVFGGIALLMVCGP